MSTYTPIIGTLGFVISPNKHDTLLVHRTARADDHHYGKFNGLGGKMHPDEDIVACMRREIREEAGIDCLDMELRGSINWPGFGPNNEDWLGFIFRINTYSGSPYSNNDEGSLVWKPISELPELPMWEGDRHFLPLIFDQDPRPFHGVMPYQNGRPVDWRYARI